MPSPDAHDVVLDALDELLTILDESTEQNQIARQRADEIRRLRESGHPYSEVVLMETRPLIVELVAETLFTLSEASSRFRKAEARVLYSEGLTMAEIAELFGVTRQRIASLLRASEIDTK